MSVKILNGLILRWKAEKKMGMYEKIALSAFAFWCVKQFVVFWILICALSILGANLGPHALLKTLCLLALIEAARWTYGFRITLQV